MTMLAVLATALVAFQGSSPPQVPNDGIPQGKGHTLLDDKFSKVKSVTSDSSLPGGQRATLRWLWWTVYVRPTGNSRITTSTTCKNPCTKVGAHAHPSECSIGTCAEACEVKSHDVEVTSSSSSSSSASVKSAVERAVTVMNKIVAEAGVEYGPFSAKVEGTHERTTTTKESWEQTISATISSSVGGSAKVSLGHFNSDPCTSETRYYGTREYELRLLCQVIEQDYYSESWVIGGGPTGILPGSRLRATGTARFVGRISDEQIGTYHLPSDEPISSKKTTDCGCRKPVITPSGGGRTTPPPGDGTTTPSGGGTTPSGQQSVIPERTQKFTVTPGSTEQVYVNNPFQTPLICGYANIVVEVKPGESKAIETRDPITPVILTTAGGAALYGIVIDRAGTSERVQVNAIKPIQPTAPTPDPGPVSIELSPNEQTPVAAPSVAPEAPRVVFSPPAPQTDNILKQVLTGGVPLGTINALGVSSGVMQAVGEFPTGAQFGFAEGTKRVIGNTLIEVREGDTIKRAYFHCPDITSLERPTPIVLDAEGRTIAVGPTMEVVRPQIQSSLEPVNGPPGSPATLVIDCREVLAILSLEGMGDPDEFDVTLDYANSGGATGPARVPMNATGIVRVEVTRGSAPGGFQVGIGLAARTPEVFSAGASCCAKK